jgi:large subunit ribosomal protein L6
MSRVGKLPISIPAGVKVSVSGPRVTVEGPNGSLTQEISQGISLRMEADTILVERAGDTKKLRALHGLSRALLGNMVQGVSQGFRKELEISGLGYRVEGKEGRIILSLGFSHQVDYSLPEGIKAEVERNKIVITGADRELVGRVAAEIRSFRPPEPYKGKGVKYAEEKIRRKVGKAGVTTGAA